MKKRKKALKLLEILGQCILKFLLGLALLVITIIFFIPAILIDYYYEWLEDLRNNFLF